MDRGFLNWAAIMGGFGLLAALGAWTTNRDCRLAGALMGALMLYIWLIALVGAAFLAGGPMWRRLPRLEYGILAHGPSLSNSASVGASVWIGSGATPSIVSGIVRSAFANRSATSIRWRMDGVNRRCAC